MPIKIDERSQRPFGPLVALFLKSGTSSCLDPFPEQA
jgi:hypothetical protein